MAAHCHANVTKLPTLASMAHTNTNTTTSQSDKNRCKWHPPVYPNDILAWMLMLVHDHTTLLTLQRCMAMSIDICIAVARFPGQCSMHTRTQVSVPPGFLKTPTLTRLNPYPYARVQVFAGMGMGSPGIPQGYLWQSLTMSESCYVIFELWKFTRAHLTR